MRKMKYSFVLALMAILIPLLIGCGSGDGYSTTGAITGSGYKVSLTVPDTVNPGGTSVIKAQVIDTNGFPAADGTKVSFSATNGTVDPAEATTTGGFATCIYTPQKDDNTENPLEPQKDKIAASSMGALTWSNEITIPYGF